MVRVQANLGYLCGASDYALRPGVKTAPHPPNYVYPPPTMPQLSDRYGKLRSFFPGWSGVDGQAMMAHKDGFGHTLLSMQGQGS